MPVLTGRAYFVSQTDSRTIPAGWLFQLCALVVLVKGLFLLADPFPAFHFGDSGSYLATALTQWIPPDRSFTYGYFLRLLVLQSHSLLPVVLVQCTLSAAASVVVSVLLIRYFRASYRVGLVFALLCAIEPLQLMSERFVMTEACATFFFSLFVWAALEFLRTQRTWILVVVQVLGVLLVSLRYSFLPLVLALPVALPALAMRWNGKRDFQKMIGNLVIAVVVSQSLLMGYRHLYGSLAHTQPAYLSRDGDFLIADMAPLLLPQDLPIASERSQVFGSLTIPLQDMNARRLHRWLPGGVCAAILRVCQGDEDRANALARKTALRAMKRDPMGVLRLGLGTYGEFLSYSKMKWGLELDRGQYVDPTDRDVTMIRDWFGVNAQERRFGSLTKRWEGVAEPWCWLMVTSPWLYGLLLLLRRPRAWRMKVLLLLSALCILGAALIPVEIANPRYLTPLPWLTCLTLGVLVSSNMGLADQGIPGEAAVH